MQEPHDDNVNSEDSELKQVWSGFQSILLNSFASVYRGARAVASNPVIVLDELIRLTNLDIGSDVGEIDLGRRHAAEHTKSNNVTNVELISSVPENPSHIVIRVVSTDQAEQTFVHDMRIPRGMAKSCQKMANILAGSGPIKKITIGLANAKQVEDFTQVNQEGSSSLAVREEGHRAATLKEVKLTISVFLSAMVQGLSENLRLQPASKAIKSAHSSILQDDKESKVSVFHEVTTESTSQGRADQTQQRPSHDGHQHIQQGDNMMGTLDPKIINSLTEFFNRTSDEMKTEIGKVTQNTTRVDLQKKLEKMKSEIDSKLREVAQQNKEPVVKALSELQSVLNVIFRVKKGNSSLTVTREEKSTYIARVGEAEQLLNRHKNDDVLLQDNGPEPEVTQNDDSILFRPNESPSTSPTPPNTSTTGHSNTDSFPKTVDDTKTDTDEQISDLHNVGLPGLDVRLEELKKEIDEAYQHIVDDEETEFDELYQKIQQMTRELTALEASGLNKRPNSNEQQEIVQTRSGENQETPVKKKPIDQMKLNELHDLITQLINLEKSSRKDILNTESISRQGVSEHARSNRFNIKDDEKKKEKRTAEDQKAKSKKLEKLESEHSKKAENIQQEYFSDLSALMNRAKQEIDDLLSQKLASSFTNRPSAQADVSSYDYEDGTHFGATQRNQSVENLDQNDNNKQSSHESRAAAASSNDQQQSQGAAQSTSTAPLQHGNEHGNLPSSSGSSNDQQQISQDPIIVAMNAAIEASEKSYGRWGDRGQKTLKLRELLGAYSDHGKSDDFKKSQLKEFYHKIIEPRSPFGVFGKALKGHTASAKAFFQALNDENAREALVEALGREKGSLPAPAPDGKNQAEFANLVNPPQQSKETDAQDQNPNDNTPSSNK